MANINQRYFLMKISTLNKQKGKVFFCCAPVASLLPDHLQPSSLVTVAASIKSPNQFDKSLISGAVSHCYSLLALNQFLLVSPLTAPHWQGWPHQQVQSCSSPYMGAPLTVTSTPPRPALELGLNNLQFNNIQHTHGLKSHGVGLSVALPSTHISRYDLGFTADLLITALCTVAGLVLTIGRVVTGGNLGGQWPLFYLPRISWEMLQLEH